MFLNRNSKLLILLHTQIQMVRTQVRIITLLLNVTFWNNNSLLFINHDLFKMCLFIILRVLLLQVNCLWEKYVNMIASVWVILIFHDVYMMTLTREECVPVWRVILLSETNVTKVCTINARRLLKYLTLVKSIMDLRIDEYVVKKNHK